MKHEFSADQSTMCQRRLLSTRIDNHSQLDISIASDANEACMNSVSHRYDFPYDPLYATLCTVVHAPVHVGRLRALNAAH